MHGEPVRPDQRAALVALARESEHLLLAIDRYVGALEQAGATAAWAETKQVSAAAVARWRILRKQVELHLYVAKSCVRTADAILHHHRRN